MDAITRERLRCIGAIYLLLGPACNMTCRHCSQTPIKNTYALKPSDELSPDVVEFIRQWMEAKGPGEYSRIYFWGGEPLLYWETIKKHILQFKSLGIHPRCFRIFSNGLLLNEEVVDFCNSHNVLFTMSYDAPNPTAVRNVAPSAENIRHFLRIRYRSINFVFSALNDDPAKAFNMLEAMFPKTIVDMGIINVLSDIPKDIYTFGPGKIERALDALADEIARGNDPYGNRYSFFREKFMQMDTFRPERFSANPWPPCAPGAGAISFRFNGDIPRCHNDNQIICNVKDGHLGIVRAHHAVWKNLLAERCANCEVLLICRNRCPIGLYRADGKEYIHCKVLRRIYGSVMRNRRKLTECDINYEDLRDWRRYKEGAMKAY